MTILQVAPRAKTETKPPTFSQVFECSNVIGGLIYVRSHVSRRRQTLEVLGVGARKVFEFHELVMCGDHGGQAGCVQFAGARRTVRRLALTDRISGRTGAIRPERTDGWLSGRLSSSSGFQMNITVMQAVAMNGDRVYGGLVEDAADVAVTEAVQQRIAVQMAAVHVLTGQMQVLDRRPIAFGQCGAAFQAHLVL